MPTPLPGQPCALPLHDPLSDYTLPVAERPRIRTVAWLDAEQAPWLRAVADAAGLDIIAVGTTQLGRAADIIAALGGRAAPKPLDDLRAALTTADADLFFLASPGDFAAGLARPAGAEGDELALDDAAARGARIITLEPMPSSLLQLDAPSLTQQGEPLLALGPDSGAPVNLAGTFAEWARFCPLLRRSEPMRAARDLISQLAHPESPDDRASAGLRTLAVECWCGPGFGSLGARLYDAVECVVHFMGVPDRVDAAYVAPSRVRAVHALPGEMLRGLEGDMTANLRFADGRAASIVASSRAGRWNRSVTFLADNGRLRVYDDGFVWIGRDGKLVDSSRDTLRVRGSVNADDPGAHAVAAVASQLVRDLDPALPPEQPVDVVGVLATAGAALLSTRTGESESPATILRMARTG